MTDASLTVSAPGKLFLIGEYAVLDGAPALLTAVDRRVRVTLAPSARWRISAPNLGLEEITLAADARLPAGIDDRTRTRLAVFDAVRAHVAEHIGLPGPQAVTIDSHDFARDGHKLGLGSSAAVAAALTRALAHAAGAALPTDALARLAIDAHRRAQNGAGSGGDVAAAVYGGLISYTRDRPPTPLSWPASLVLRIVITGTGARTADLVARVRAYAQHDPDAHAAAIARLSALADEAQHALAEDARFLRLAEAYHQALRALDHGADAGIVEPHHETLHTLAARYNAVFKTSGAGGGDVGLVFVHRGEDDRRVCEAFAETGAQIVPMAFGAPGVRIESATADARARLLY